MASGQGNNAQAADGRTATKKSLSDIVATEKCAYTTGQGVDETADDTSWAVSAISFACILPPCPLVDVWLVKKQRTKTMDICYLRFRFDSGDIFIDAVSWRSLPASFSTI